jgi:hypothetical protein
MIGWPCLGVCTHCDPINSETMWTTLPPRTAMAAALVRGTCTHPHVLRLRHALAVGNLSHGFGSDHELSDAILPSPLSNQLFSPVTIAQPDCMETAHGHRKEFG